MIRKGIPKPLASGELAQNAVWYSLLGVLAIVAVISISNQSWQLPSAFAASEPAQDLASSSVVMQRSFTRGISESISVASTFGSPAAPPQSFTRTISDSVGVTTGFAPPQSQAARATIDSTPYRTSQYYPGSGQRTEERLNFKNLANNRGDTINGRGYSGGTPTNVFSEYDVASSFVGSNPVEDHAAVSGDSGGNSEDDNSSLCILGTCIDLEKYSLTGLMTPYGLDGDQLAVTILSYGTAVALVSIALTSRGSIVERFVMVAFRTARLSRRTHDKKWIHAIFLLVILFLAIPSQMLILPAFATITYVGAGTASSATAVSGGNAQTLPSLPTGLQVNDLMILVHYMTSTSGGSVTTPTGWTVLQLTHQDSGGSITIWYRLYQSGDAAPTVDTSGLTNTGNSKDSAISQIAAWRGVDTSAPVATTGTVSTNTAQQNIGPISGITLGANNVVVVMGGKISDWTSVATLSGDSLTWNAIGEPTRVASQTKNSGLVWDYAINGGSSTAVTSKTFTVTGGVSAVGKGVMFALKVSAAASYSGSPADSATISDSAARTVHFNRSISDSLTITDTAARKQVITKSISDSMTSTDSAARVLHASRSISDSLTTSDNVKMSVTRDIADAVAIGDTPTRSLIASRSISDPATITDSISTRVSRSISDSVAISDSIAAGKSFDRSLSDSTTITDSIKMAVTRDISGTVTFSDSIATSLVASRSNSDTVSITDVITPDINRSLSDSTTISDSPSPTYLASRSVSDSVVVTESISTAVSHTLSDSITLSDAISAGKHFDRSTSESTTITDSISMTISRDIADSATISDSISPTLAATRSISDSTTISDSISTKVSRSISDSTTITDAIAAGKHFDRPISDSAAIADSASPTYLASRTTTNTVTTTDSISTRVSRSIIDSMVISDSPAAGKHFERSISDSATVADSAAKAVTRDVADAVTLNDTTAKSLAATRPTSDSLSMTDVIARTVSRSASDALSVTDNISAQKSFGRPTSDSISITDNAATALSASRSTSDSVTVSDAIAFTYHAARSMSDTIAIADAAAAGKHFDRSLSDSATMTDSIVMAATRDIVDTATFNDNITMSLTADRTPSDALSITDAIARGVSRSTSETLSIADGISVENALGRPTSDSASFTDSLAATLAATRSTSDSLTVSDAITAAYHAARSISDTMTTTVDIAAGKSFTREITDAITIADSPAATLAATRTVSDTAILSDSSDRTITLSISVSDAVSLTANVGAGNVFDRTVADSLTVSDTAAYVSHPVISPAETVTIGDNITFELGPNRSTVDTIVITDSINKSVSRALSDTVTISDTMGDHFSRNISDSLTVGEVAVAEVQGHTIELSDAVGVTAQLGVSVTYSLNFDESLTLGECTPFACNQSLNFYETVGLTDAYVPPPSIQESITVSDSVSAAKTFGRLVSDTLSVQPKLGFIVKFLPPTPSGGTVPDLRVQITTDKNLVEPMSATPITDTYTGTSNDANDLMNWLNPPTRTLDTTVTNPDLPKVAVVLPTYHINMTPTEQVPGKDAMLTVKVAQIPSETPVIVPVHMAATTAMNKTPEVPWMKVDFTPNIDANNFALLINVLDEPPAKSRLGAQVPPPQADLKPLYVDVRWVGTDSSGNPLDMSDPSYYMSNADPTLDGHPTFTFAVTDEWANSNNAQRDSNGVPMITLNLLDDSTGAWDAISNSRIDRPTGVDANGQYVFTAHLDHFSTYVITANASAAAPSTVGGRGHASLTVPLSDSLQTIDAPKATAVEVIEEFGGRKFNVALVDQLAVSTRQIAYQTFQVGENVQVSIGLDGITSVGILPQTARASFLVHVENSGPRYEKFQLNFWYYDQTGKKAYESSQEIEIGPFESKDSTVEVPFSSPGVFAVVAEARSVPEGNLINATQFTVNIPWLSIYFYTLVIAAVAIMGASSVAVAILLIKRDVRTPAILAVPLRRLAGKASALSIVRKTGVAESISSKLSSAAKSFKRFRATQGKGETPVDAGTGGLLVSVNWANTVHGSLPIGEYTAVIDFDAVNRSKGQIFLMRYWAVNMAGDVVYSSSETLTIDQDRSKLWRLKVDLQSSGDYIFHMEAKSARDGKLESSAQITIKVP